jgi:hypothetical protein
MKDGIKKGLFVGGAAVGVIALALAGAPVQAAEPSIKTTTTESGAGGGIKTTTTESGGGAMPTTTEIIHVTAVVTAIDRNARKVTIRTPDGEKTVVQAPVEMKAFDKLKVGDKIEVDYMESMALGMMPPGSSPAMVERTVAGGGAAGREVTMSAEIVSVDVANNKVTFKGPKGAMRTVKVQNPDLQARLPNLKPGQVITLKYTEAVAASIQPTGK